MTTTRLPRPQPARTVSTAMVVDHLKARLREGLLTPGQRLVEPDIIRETGATRLRVREALRRLEAEGIVVIAEFRGASVKQFTPEEVRGNHLAREVLECLCARLAAESATSAELEELQALQEEMNRCEAENDADGFGDLNEAWHSLIINAARNPEVKAFLERLRLPVLRLQFTRFYSRGAMATSNADHRPVTAAIVARETEAAERAMREHVRHSHEAVANFEAPRADGGELSKRKRNR